MNFLDPHKQARQRFILFVGYACIAIAIFLGTRLLVDQAYGYSLNKNGQVIQNGLVFISSQPNPASIYLNKTLNNNTTNARLLLPAGIYKIELKRGGYREWWRYVGVDGGMVVHFDYPFLFPAKLITSKVQSYTSGPGLATQSPDRRWLLIQAPGSTTAFDEYDLKDPKKVITTTINIPTTILSKASSSESWQLDEWADDNQHVVLEHLFDGKLEYILLNRQNPAQSVNLSTALTTGTTPTKLTLSNKKYDQYYIYDASGSLQTASLSSPAPVAILQHVLAYQSYGSNTLLYVTDDQAPTGKVLVKLQVGTQTYIVHSFPTGGTYLLDLTQYAGTLYVAAGDSQENKVYIYKDPVAQLQTNPSQAVAPIQVLHVQDPNYLSFSASTQYIVAEHGSQFGVYDIENKNGYNYTSRLPLDSPQLHATWMDGDRLTYISGGKLVVFDYDYANQQTLMPLAAAYLPFFSSNYHYVYGLAPATNGSLTDLTQTSLLVPADQ